MMIFLLKFLLLSQQETPNSAGEWELNVSTRSNISYETKIDKDRRSRTWSSRNGLWQKKQVNV